VFLHQAITISVRVRQPNASFAPNFPAQVPIVCGSFVGTDQCFLLSVDLNAHGGGHEPLPLEGILGCASAVSEMTPIGVGSVLARIAELRMEEGCSLVFLVSLIPSWFLWELC
jgi:hypothetical protein